MLFEEALEIADRIVIDGKDYEPIGGIDEGRLILSDIETGDEIEFSVTELAAKNVVLLSLQPLQYTEQGETSCL